MRNHQYRPDIDGLRAIAVLSVIVFHLAPHALPGGFVGVDIFFVISGYLITRNIVDEIEAGTFSLWGFYARRVKRIAPAMLVVVGVTVLGAWWLLMPEDAAAVGKSAVWSLASLANVYFWLSEDTTYFAQAANQLPLLHLWSLGVEEQFYACWPLLLLITAARWRPFIPIAVAIAIGSFILGDVMYPRDPSFAYYMLATRAGELLLGALAVAATRRAALSGPQAIGLAGTGLLLIATSFVWLSETSHFPGVRAAVPTLGAAALILAGSQRNAVSDCLSVKPVVAIGLISYSAYLWHWPLLAFWRYGYGEVRWASGAALFALTLVLASLSYRFIEQPSRRVKWSLPAIFAGQYVLPASVVGGLALMLVFGARLGIASKPYRTRLTSLRSATAPAFLAKSVCQRQQIRSVDLLNPDCLVGPDTATGEALLWGDSNAAHWIGMIDVFARHANFRFRNIEAGSCPPLIDPQAFVAARRAADCGAASDTIWPLVQRSRVLIIAASWPGYTSQSDGFMPAFLKMTHDLAAQGKYIILIGKIPRMEGFDRRCPEKALTFPLLECPRLSKPLDRVVSEANGALREFAAREPNVEYFDAADFLCDGGLCHETGKDGEHRYYDAEHLNMQASYRLGEQIVNAAGVPPAFRAISGRASGAGVLAVADGESAH